MLARRAGLDVVYNGVNITADLKPHLIGWTYTDNMSAQSDDLQITLEDREQKWIGPWFPEKGATLNASIIRTNWETDGHKDKLGLGLFEIDEIEIGYPPSTVAIKALSIPEGSASLRRERKNKGWDADPVPIDPPPPITLAAIVGTIAGDNGMGVVFDSSYNPVYDRVEQTEQTDLEFLTRLCSDAALSLKIADKSIIVIDDAKYEAAGPITTIKRGEFPIISYQARTSLNEVYTECVAEYTDAKTKQTYSYTFTPPNPPQTGKTLHVNRHVRSQVEVEMLARRSLRQENAKETDFSITLPGDVRFIATVTVQLQNFGAFDDKYIITQAVHSQQDKYETKLQLRRCLGW